MKLTPGITSCTPEWQLILTQIGVPFSTIDLSVTSGISDCPAIIVSSSLTNSEILKVLEYVSNGGTILIEADTGHLLFNIKTQSLHIKYFEPQYDDIFAAVNGGYFDGQLRLPKHGTHLMSDSGKNLVQIYRHGEGVALILPGGFIRGVLDTSVRRRNFPTNGPTFPSERVSRRSKGVIRAVVEKSLQFLFQKRQLPLVTLYPFPDGVSTIFNFRIDTDFSSEDDVKRLYDLCRKHNIEATWFVETASAANWINRYAQMENQEIGLHCFKHRLFASFSKNQKNVRQGVDLLTCEKIHPDGFAAPFGLWNRSLSKAVEHHGFIYSSEFALDYDNLPLYPFLKERFSTVLQVPVHPVSTSSLRNAHHTFDDMTTYLDYVIAKHVQYRLPLFFYDHPSNANLDALNWLFERISDISIRQMKLGDYARWWIERTSTKWTPLLEDGRIRIKQINCPASLHVQIHRGVQEWAITEMKDEINISDLYFQPEVIAKTESPMSARSAYTWKMMVNDILHYYWKFRL